MNKLKEGDKYFFIPEDINSENTIKIVGCLVDGKPSQYKELSFPEANQHARWQLINKDIEFSESNMLEVLRRIKGATETITMDRRNVESIIIKALIESAVVSYIKCFNHNLHGHP